jgi:glycosyltransferase involved in cell wall biosynthesis
VLIVHNAFTLHFNLALTAALWDLARLRVPGSTVAWCHDLSWVNPLYIPRMHAGYPWNLLRLRAPNVVYVVISQERERELARLWGTDGSSIAVIPNGIDPVRFLRLSPDVDAIVRRFRLLERDAVLLLPVRITRRKNIEAGIRAMRPLVDQGLDALFVISGPRAPHHPGLSDGYLDRLLALVEELDLRDHVVFLTHEIGRTLPTDDVNQLYSVADALLFPSAQEGFGLPILEAGLARIPAIISDIPVFHEVGDGDVWRFDPDASAGTIASVIVEALGGKPAQLYRRVLARYRWDAIVERDIIPLLDAGIQREHDGH